MAELLTGHWWLKHLLVLIVLIVLINLGLWQLRRLEERRALNQNIQAALSQPALPLRDAQIDPEVFHFRRVAVTGIFDNANSIVLRNQLMGDTPGVHLVTPLRLSGSEQAVLIDRGWLPRPTADLEPADLIPYEVNSEVTLEGIAYRTQTRSGWLSPLDPPLREGQTRLVNWFRVDIDRIQTQVPYPLLPIFIKQLPDSSTQPDTLPQPEALTLTEGSHLGYALQWFSFAVILVITYGLFLRQQIQKSVSDQR